MLNFIQWDHDTAVPVLSLELSEVGGMCRSLGELVILPTVRTLFPKSLVYVNSPIWTAVQDCGRRQFPSLLLQQLHSGDAPSTGPPWVTWLGTVALMIPAI